MILSKTIFNLELKFHLILQLFIRKIVELLLFLSENFKKKLIFSHFQAFILNFFDLGSSSQLQTMKFFLKKKLSYKNFLSNFFSWNWVDLFNFYLILENWLKMITFYKIYNSFKKICKHFCVKNLHSFNNKCKSKYQAGSGFFSVSMQLILGLIVRKWILFKNKAFFSFHIKKKLYKNFHSLWEKLNIKKFRIFLYLKNTQLKKVLLIEKWNIRFKGVYEKFSPEFFMIKFLENLIEYTGIKIYKTIFDDLKMVFFNFFILNYNHLVSKKILKKKIFLFSNMYRFNIFFLKNLEQEKHRMDFYLPLFFFKYFKKKINFQLNVKIHRCFLIFYEKISLVLIHMEKLKTRLHGVFFFNTKLDKNLFLSKYTKSLFFLRNESLSFMKKFDQVFLKKIKNFELEFYKFLKNKKFSIDFLNRCKLLVMYFYQIFFLDTYSICIFKLFRKILFYVYSFKNFLIQLNYEEYFYTIDHIHFSKIYFFSTGDFVHFLNYKLNNYKTIFEKIICIFSMSIFKLQNLKKRLPSFNFNFFYFDKFFI